MADVLKNRLFIFISLSFSAMRKWFFLFILVSCGSQSDEFGETIPLDLSEEPKRQLMVYCFYKLDDKYSETHQATEIEAWLTAKTENLLLADTRGNLFDRNGAGPNGAEWNPSTDLYVALVNANPEAEVKMNDEVCKADFTIIQGVYWLVIPLDHWQARLKSISDEDAAALFEKDGELERPTDEIELLQPKTIGEILKFEIKSDNQTAVHYFHAAFGE